MDVFVPLVCLGAPGACGDQKETSNPLTVESQIVGSYHVLAGNQAQVL